MDLMDKARNTITRAEVAAEFYAFPQKYVVGMSQDAEPLDIASGLFFLGRGIVTGDQIVTLADEDDNAHDGQKGRKDNQYDHRLSFFSGQRYHFFDEVIIIPC